MSKPQRCACGVFGTGVFLGAFFAFCTFLILHNADDDNDDDDSANKVTVNLQVVFGNNFYNRYRNDRQFRVRFVTNFNSQVSTYAESLDSHARVYDGPISTHGQSVFQTGLVFDNVHAANAFADACNERLYDAFPLFEMQTNVYGTMSLIHVTVDGDRVTTAPTLSPTTVQTPRNYLGGTLHALAPEEQRLADCSNQCESDDAVSVSADEFVVSVDEADPHQLQFSTAFADDVVAAALILRTGKNASVAQTYVEPSRIGWMSEDWSTYLDIAYPLQLVLRTTKGQQYVAYVAYYHLLNTPRSYNAIARRVDDSPYGKSYTDYYNSALMICFCTCDSSFCDRPPSPPPLPPRPLPPLSPPPFMGTCLEYTAQYPIGDNPTSAAIVYCHTFRANMTLVDCYCWVCELPYDPSVGIVCASPPPTPAPLLPPPPPSPCPPPPSPHPPPPAIVSGGDYGCVDTGNTMTHTCALNTAYAIKMYVSSGSIIDSVSFTCSDNSQVYIGQKHDRDCEAYDNTGTRSTDQLFGKGLQVMTYTHGHTCDDDYKFAMMTQHGHCTSGRCRRSTDHNCYALAQQFISCPQSYAPVGFTQVKRRKGILIGFSLMCKHHNMLQP